MRRPVADADQVAGQVVGFLDQVDGRAELLGEFAERIARRDGVIDFFRRGRRGEQDLRIDLAQQRPGLCPAHSCRRPTAGAGRARRPVYPSLFSASACWQRVVGGFRRGCRRGRSGRSARLAAGGLMAGCRCSLRGGRTDGVDAGFGRNPRASHPARAIC